MGPPPASPPRQIPWWQSRGFRLGLSVILIATAAVVFFVGRGSGNASAHEVFLQGNDAPGTNNFTPSIASPTPAAGPNATTVPAPSANGLITAKGDAAGLYAGTRNVPSCNGPALVSSLEKDPAKAKPWADAVKIQTTEIKPFVATLTSVNLRVDTRVTEYQLRGGKAVPKQSVLQAGTAVMLDRTGFPRVRCLSGNPLAEPQAVSGTPSYAGTRWPRFSPQTIVVVQPAAATTPFILIDSPTGSIFLRIPGGIADVDRPPVGVTIQLCEAGGPFGVTGGRFPPGTPITLTFDTPPVVLANVTADGGGNFSVQVTCPPDATVGVHQVTATGGGFTLAQPVYVIPPAPLAPR
jgi:hypothetical protein